MLCEKHVCSVQRLSKLENSKEREKKLTFCLHIGKKLWIMHCQYLIMSCVWIKQCAETTEKTTASVTVWQAQKKGKCKLNAMPCIWLIVKSNLQIFFYKVYLRFVYYGSIVLSVVRYLCWLVRYLSQLVRYFF